MFWTLPTEACEVWHGALGRVCSEYDSPSWHCVITQVYAPDKKTAKTICFYRSTLLTSQYIWSRLPLSHLNPLESTKLDWVFLHAAFRFWLINDKCVICWFCTVELNLNSCRTWWPDYIFCNDLIHKILENNPFKLFLFFFKFNWEEKNQHLECCSSFYCTNSSDKSYLRCYDVTDKNRGNIQKLVWHKTEFQVLKESVIWKICLSFRTE